MNGLVYRRRCENELRRRGSDTVHVLGRSVVIELAFPPRVPCTRVGALARTSNAHKSDRVWPQRLSPVAYRTHGMSADVFWRLKRAHVMGGVRYSDLLYGPI